MIPLYSRSATQPADHPPGLPPAENKIFYPALDGLRAVAVLLVFTFHYAQLPRALNWGWAGVDLFFVLSGFLITGILYDSRDRLHRYRIFYLRRTLRIFPLYYLILFLPLLSWPVFHWHWHRGLLFWPLYIGNYLNFAFPSEVIPNASPFQVLLGHIHQTSAFFSLDHLWSLSVEEQFYLVWPLLVFSIRNRIFLRNACLLLVALAPLARWICLHHASPATIDRGLLYFVTPLRIDSLLLGAAAALALRGPEARRVLAAAGPLTLASIAAFVLLDLQFRLRTGSFLDANVTMFHSAILFTLFALLSVALILLLLQPGTALFRFATLSPLRALGQRSYGFYVYHLAFFSLFKYIARTLMLGHARWLGAGTAAVALAGTLLLCWLSFRFIETPILKLKDRFAR